MLTDNGWGLRPVISGVQTINVVHMQVSSGDWNLALHTAGQRPHRQQSSASLYCVLVCVSARVCKAGRQMPSPGKSALVAVSAACVERVVTLFCTSHGESLRAAASAFDAQACSSGNITDAQHCFDRQGTTARVLYT